MCLYDHLELSEMNIVIMVDCSAICQIVVIRFTNFVLYSEKNLMLNDSGDFISVRTSIFRYHLRFMYCNYLHEYFVALNSLLYNSRGVGLDQTYSIKSKM